MGDRPGSGTVLRRLLRLVQGEDFRAMRSVLQVSKLLVFLTLGSTESGNVISAVIWPRSFVNSTSGRVSA